MRATGERHGVILGHVGVTWNTLGSLRGHFGALLGLLWDTWGPLRSHMGTLWDTLGCLGGTLDRLGITLEQFWAIWGFLVTIGQSWAPQMGPAGSQNEPGAFQNELPSGPRSIFFYFCVIFVIALKKEAWGKVRHPLGTHLC